MIVGLPLTSWLLILASFVPGLALVIYYRYRQTSRLGDEKKASESKPDP